LLLCCYCEGRYTRELFHSWLDVWCVEGYCVVGHLVERTMKWNEERLYRDGKDIQQSERRLGSSSLSPRLSANSPVYHQTSLANCRRYFAPNIFYTLQILWIQAYCGASSKWFSCIISIGGQLTLSYNFPSPCFLIMRMPCNSNRIKYSGPSCGTT
jgi:hypothetical protein